MTVLDANIAKNEAAQEAEWHKNKEVKVTGITQEWEIKEYALRLLSGGVGEYVTKAVLMTSTPKQGPVGGRGNVCSHQVTLAPQGAGHQQQEPSLFKGSNALKRKKWETIMPQANKQ